MLLDAVERSDMNKGKRMEPKGVHFVESGEVLVIGKNKIPNMRLNRCEAFGLCDVVKKPGPEYFGDVRAGIKQV